MEAPDPRRWSQKIHNLLSAKRFSQADLATALGVSPATVSRWLSERSEPTPQAYVALGNLAAPPDDAYFWDRAGIRLKPADDHPPQRSSEGIALHAEHLHRYASERRSRIAEGDPSIVAVPLLGVCAYADELPPQKHVSLAQAEVEDFITAPLSWCPHPEDLIGLHICGSSMHPTMQDGALAVVDLATHQREELNHELVIASHRDLGLKVARLQRLSDCYVLVPANASCLPIDISNAARWKIVGKVLWWVTRDNVASHK